MGPTIPQLGFGVFKVDPAETTRIVTDALEVGYRHIDTAAIYGNEEGVGQALAASGIPREELFVTTKLWNDRQTDAESAFDESPRQARASTTSTCTSSTGRRRRSDTFVEAWKSLEKIYASGRAKAIGVSNFLVPHLEKLLAETDVVPAVNQIELHPAHQQPEVTAFAREHGIEIEAWGPLGQGKYPLFETPEVARRRRSARQDAGAGRHPLAPADREHRLPQVEPARAHGRELRRLRLRADRRRGRGDQLARARGTRQRPPRRGQLTSGRPGVRRSGVGSPG